MADVSSAVAALETSLASTRAESGDRMPAEFDAVAQSFRHLLEEEIAPLLKCRDTVQVDKVLAQVGSRVSNFRRWWFVLVREALAESEGEALEVVAALTGQVLGGLATDARLSRVLGEWGPKHAVQLRMIARRNSELARFSKLGIDPSPRDLAALQASATRTEVLLYALVTAVERGRRLPAPVAELLVEALEAALFEMGRFIAPMRQAARAQLPVAATEKDLTDDEAAQRESLAELGIEEWARDLAAEEGKARPRRSVGARPRQGPRPAAGR